jgi:hypothetical protein
MRTQVRPTALSAKAVDARATPSAADAHAWQAAASAAAGRLKLAGNGTAESSAGRTQGERTDQDDEAELAVARPGAAHDDAEAVDGPTDNATGSPAPLASRSLAEMTDDASEAPSGSGRAAAALPHAGVSRAADARSAATKAGPSHPAQNGETAETKALPQDCDPAARGDGPVTEQDRKASPRHQTGRTARSGATNAAAGSAAPAATASNSTALAAGGQAAPASGASATPSASPSPAPVAAASGTIASLAQSNGAQSNGAQSNGVQSNAAQSNPALTAPTSSDNRSRLAAVQTASALTSSSLSSAPYAAATPASAGTAAPSQADQPGLQRAAADLAFMGGGSISVTLRPPTLGSVQVQMAIGATGAAHIQLTAATRDGYSALAAAGPALVQHLAGAGVTVGSLRTAMQGGSGQGQPQQEHPRGNGAPLETSRTDNDGEDRILGYA